ncbi:hypothetical protein KAF25_011145 [Fusarium avenaceum]|uniref:Rhodopsin domain-containing protein n=1 Tax=Fusarium avenaceum TaxID=40199 RepID=A0A9P7GV61_9HYPO|nr:hypothetical protein KAF25_011145 [Fusarium avenaceum]
MISSRAVMGFEWTLMTLAYVMVACRIYVRVVIKRAKLYSADYWLLVGLASCQGLLICDTLTFRMNAMDEFTMNNVSLKKIRFATNYFFDTGIYFPKFSIITFYANLVPVTHPEMRTALYVLAAITTAFALATFFGDTFWCGADPSVNWAEGEDNCQAFMSMTLMRLNWGMNFTSEVLNVLYPIPLVRGLIMASARKKAGVAVIFGLGIITIIVSIGRFVTTTFVSNDISIYIWATAEICISVIVVALTALRPLLRQISNTISTSATMSDARSRVPTTIVGQSRRPSMYTAGSGHYWQGSNNRNAKGSDFMTGSETQLNNTNGILMTHQVSVSSETIHDMAHRRDDFDV